MIKKKYLKKANKSVAMKEAQELDYSKDGSVQINVGIKSAEDFFAPYSYLTYEFTNSEIIDYINMCEVAIPDKEPISIDIYTEEPTTNEEKKRIRQSIKRYYAEQIVRLKKQQQKNITWGIFYIFLGIALLLCQSFFNGFFTQIHSVFLVEVGGWLFLWDGLETIIGEWNEIGEQKKQSYHLLSAKIHVRQYSKKIQREYGIGEFEEEEE